MPLREIQLHPDFGDGLDFAEFWDDRALVETAVWKLHVSMHATACYCLRLHAVHGGVSYFEPYGYDGLSTLPDLRLHQAIPYSYLLTPDAGWPILADWLPQSTESLSQPSLAAVAWRGFVRIKSGREYVGYFVVEIQDGPPSDHDRMREAYREVRLWLSSAISERRRRMAWGDDQVSSLLKNLHRAIARDIRGGATRSAIQRLATFITSHRGAGFNRIACLAPVSDHALWCVYAHGGDCSQAWIDRVQAPLANSPSASSEWPSLVSPNPLTPPFDDPLYYDVVLHRPLMLELDSTESLLAEIWLRGGSLDWLPKETAVEDYRLAVDSEAVPWLRSSRIYNIAAIVNVNDPWLRNLRVNRPDSPLLRSRNGTFFALPWALSGKVLGLWLLDLGYWSSFDLAYDVLPMLRSAVAILTEFATEFESVVDLVSGWVASGASDLADILDDWTWAVAEHEAGRFAAYEDGYVAVVGRRIVASGPSARELRYSAAALAGIHPDRVVVMYVERDR